MNAYHVKVKPFKSIDMPSIFEQTTSYRPFSFPWAVEREYAHRVEMNWHEGQVKNLKDDLRQFSSDNGLKLPNSSHETNKYIIEQLSLLFTQMDMDVGAGYAKLLPHVKNNEIRRLFFTFGCRESGHQGAYALAAETFGFTNSDWSRFREYKEMSDKIDIMTQDLGDLSDPVNFLKQLAVVLLGEGIGLFGAFTTLLNYQRYGKIIGFNTINEWSLKDEQDHVDCNTKVFINEYKQLSVDKQSDVRDFFLKTVDAYVEAEYKFTDLVYEMGSPEGMTKSELQAFIRWIGDYRAYKAGFADDPGKNPLEWMTVLLTGARHDNFFEKAVAEYTHITLVPEESLSRFAIRAEEHKRKVLLGEI